MIDVYVDKSTHEYPVLRSTVILFQIEQHDAERKSSEEESSSQGDSERRSGESLASIDTDDSFLGINFNKQFGQHILKNPLIIASMVDKVIDQQRATTRRPVCSRLPYDPRIPWWKSGQERAI
jgi:hypothetical protein